MRKKKAQKTKSSSTLPSNRVELFFDVIKQRWRLLILLGFFFFLSILPFLAILVLRRVFVLSSNDNYQFFVSNLFFFLVASISILIISIPLGGILKNLKHLSYEEPIFLKDDLVQGIKESFLPLLLAIFIFSILFFLNISVCLFPTAHIAFKGIAAGALVFVFFPYLMVLVNQISVYSNSIKDYFHNSLLVFIKNYFRVLLVSLINLASILLFLISNVVILSTCLFLYFILINPFVLIFDVIYFNYIFDISINKEYYPDIFEKGLFKQKNTGDN